jgi:GTP-binding protein
MLVDTAGIRKKSKVHEDLEFYSVMRAINALEECDVCLLVLDATDGIESQDMSLFHLAHRRNKGIVVLINKWDLVEKNTNTARDYEKEVRERLRPFDDVPILFISVLEKQRLFKVVEAAMEVVENRKRKITTSQLNETMLEIIKAVPPPTHRAHQIKIKYVMQLPTYYPAFAFFCNHPKHVKDSYRNFLENKLRENYNFKGVPISVFFREK